MRYIIGIDLGTTNCSLSYVDTESANFRIHPFRIPQITDIGYVEALASLPSFCYLSSQNEFPVGTMQLPWGPAKDLIVGEFAKKHGGKIPTRLVQSAKSWLCHTAANRRDAILPIHEAADKKISPVQATTAYLKAIKDAWNHKMAKGNPECDFSLQEVILTVPASFDEVARLLTIEAAKAAGFANMALLEEPQAAFYSWISAHETSADTDLNIGDLILVVDVGGGTTDFSLIEVTLQGDKKVFQRMAVGDHLLLGGDNMDALIAYDLQKKLTTVNNLQQLQLYQEARNAKEALLGNSEKTYKILLQGAGSSVIKGSVSLEVSKEEIENRLMNGFFEFCSFDETKHLRKTAGIKTLGLPFADEPSIVKQMGHFLHTAGLKKPDYILFNGGTMKPVIFQDAILKALNGWFPDKTIKTLRSVNLDLAVSLGAAYYGKVRRGFGSRISGGAARGYYLGLGVKENNEVVEKAICCLPRGSEEDSSYESELTFLVTPNKPIAFQLYTSHVRLFDKTGQIIDVSQEEFQALPEIHTILRYGKKNLDELTQDKIPVHLKVKLSAIGTLEISLLSQISCHIWELEFQLKNVSSQDNSLEILEKTRNDETFDLSYLIPAKKALKDAFSKEGTTKLENLMEYLETLLEKPKKDFPPSILRALFDTLLLKSEGRFLSKSHEERFFNLAGFFLRPGFGYPLDDFRIKELWKIILNDSKSVKSFESQIQRLICYRRVAGGLNKGQQMQLGKELTPELEKGKIEIKSKTDLYQYSEKIRAFASFEYIDVTLKSKIGQAILDRLDKKIAVEADYFALGRLGNRHLVYAPVSQILPLKTVIQWIEKLLFIKDMNEEKLAVLLSLLGRKTDLPEFNIPSELVDKILKRFESSKELDMLTRHLTTLSHLTINEQSQVFGESLPLGLLLEL